MPKTTNAAIKFHGAELKMVEVPGPLKEYRWAGSYSLPSSTGKVSHEVELSVLRNPARNIRVRRTSTKAEGSAVATIDNIVIDFDHDGNLDGVDPGEVSPGKKPNYINRIVEEQQLKALLGNALIAEWLERELAVRIVRPR